MTKQASKKKATKIETFAKDFSDQARAINSGLRSLKTLQGKIDDKRLELAVQLADMKNNCESAGINFKQWADLKLQAHSWQTIRKLIPIGTAEITEEGAGKAILDEKRAQSAATSAKARAKSKEKQSAASEPATVPAGKKLTAKQRRAAEQQAAKENTERLQAIFLALPEQDRIAFLQWAESQETQS